jgi:hypothetical protein
MLATWKHCPHCGFKVLVPELVCILEGTPADELPDDWNPLFLRASDIADDLILNKFAQTQVEIADSDWGTGWVEEFNHNHMRIVYVYESEAQGGEAKFALNLVITGRSAESMLKDKFPGLEDVQVRLVDDGWYMEVDSFENDDWQAEEGYALLLQENYGGEILVAKPRKKKA